MQAEIIELLEKEKRPMSRSEIARTLNESEIKVSLRIRKMIKWKDIKFVEVDRLQAMEKYHCNRRLRLYYV
jgi:DNA invertase Pin-like site-specific DNA recombinase